MPDRRSLNRASIDIPPNWIQPRSFRSRVHRFLSRHSDALPIIKIRQLLEIAVIFLHSENHDPKSNGEYKIVDKLASQLRSVIDVGANRGDWTAYVIEKCPGVHVYCFEIAGPSRTILRSRFVGKSNVIIPDNGLGDSTYQCTVKYYPENDRLTSLFDYPHSEPYIVLHERIGRGDDFLATEGIKHVDYIKIDTEGADLAVIQGFEKALKKCVVDVVQFEYGFACILARVFLLDFYEIFAKFNYVVGRVRRTHVEFKPYRLEAENFFGPNFVAVHRSRPELIRRLAQRS